MHIPKKFIDDVVIRAKQNCVATNFLHHLEDEEAQLFIEDKNLTSMPKTVTCAANDLKHEHFTTCAMHQLVLGCTKPMIEDSDTMMRSVKKRIEFTKQGQRMH